MLGPEDRTSNLVTVCMLVTCTLWPGSKCETCRSSGPGTPGLPRCTCSPSVCVPASLIVIPYTILEISKFFRPTSGWRRRRKMSIECGYSLASLGIIHGSGSQLCLCNIKMWVNSITCISSAKKTVVMGSYQNDILYTFWWYSDFADKHLWSRTVMGLIQKMHIYFPMIPTYSGDVPFLFGPLFLKVSSTQL